MYTWVVKFFNSVKNFGFIKLGENQADLFFHGSKMKTTVKEWDEVTFGIAEGRKWPEALDVDLVVSEEEED
jgi:CspA family cold shock protein